VAESLVAAINGTTPDVEPDDASIASAGAQVNQDLCNACSNSGSSTDLIMFEC